MINGETVEIPRVRPSLTPDVIPTLFPNVPAYVSKKLPLKRKTATSTECVPHKRKKDDHSDERDDSDVLSTWHCDNSNGGLDSVIEVDLPSKFWSRHLISSAPNVVAFSVYASNAETLCFQKLLLCSISDVDFHCTAYVQGSLVKSVNVSSVIAVKELLFQLDAMSPCEGLEMLRNIENTKTKHKVYGGKCYSIKCCGISQNETRCLQCKYLRKLLLNQASYKRTRARQANLSRKLVRKNKQLRRQRLSIGKLSDMVKKMKQDNEAMSTAHFETVGKLVEKAANAVSSML